MKTSLRRMLRTDSSFRQLDRFKSLYIHVPFCKNICDYCTLYSVVNDQNSVRDLYLRKITADIVKNKHKLDSLASVFIGGGTPSQLTELELTKLLSVVVEHCRFDRDFEFTVECNPSSISATKLKIMRDFGVNRLSFGAQSTSRKTRNTLGRRTSQRQFIKAVELARKVSFVNINADLIYGIPGQTLNDWIKDLRNITSLNLPHISAYSLILEKGSIMSQDYSVVDDKIAVDMYNQTAVELISQHTYRYEISNYSMVGFECRHNYHIWKGMTYLGIGPAASSFDGQRRWTQISDLNKWLEGAPPEIDDIPEVNRLAEVVAFGFRTVDGWHREELGNIYHKNALNTFSATFTKLIEDGLLVENECRIKPTEKGLLFADDIVESFLYV